jgi:hypothetical protein
LKFFLQILHFRFSQANSSFGRLTLGTEAGLLAARCFLGLPKHATSAGVLAEISWTEPVYREQIRMIRQCFRILKMENHKLTKQIYLWDKSVMGVPWLSTTISYFFVG